MLLIGSSAIKYWFKDFREPTDIDYLVPRSSTLVSQGKYDYHYAVTTGLVWILKHEIHIASPKVLLSMKLACTGGDEEKTASDISFLTKKGVIPIDTLVTQLRKDFTFYLSCNFHELW